MSVIYGCPVISSRAAWVSSPFGVRTDPVTGKAGAAHYGIDLQDAISWGIVDILPLAPGKVTEVRGDCTWSWAITKSLDKVPVRDYSGNYVVIDHGGGFSTVYKHLSEVFVYTGQTVRKGESIGKMGTTGYSTGVHLHFEMRENGAAFDPAPFLKQQKFLPGAAADSGTDSGLSLKAGADSVPSKWAEDALRWALDSKLIFGDEIGDLRLREPCTREMALVFLYRMWLMSKDTSQYPAQPD